MQIKADNVFLAETGRRQPRDLRINGGPVLVPEEFLGALEIEVRDRGNIQTHVSFSVSREHKSEPEAADFMVDHYGAAVGLRVVELIGTRSRRFLRAGVTIADSHQDGRTTWHSYDLTAGMILTKRPTI